MEADATKSYVSIGSGGGGGGWRGKGRGVLSSGEKRRLPIVDLACVLDILHLCLHKIYTLTLPSSFAAGRRMHSCQLHMSAGRDALVSKSPESSPQRGTC